MSNKPLLATYAVPCVTWLLRLVIGVTFIVSGLSKMIDVWGFVYKIEQYLNVWGWEFTRPMTVVGAMSLSAIEFVVGLMLATGCYRRLSAWLSAAVMAVMLPLSAYIMIANPVDHCGCFGDLWVISNTATFFKNLLITAVVAYLCVFNRRTKGLFHNYLQWIVAAVSYIYVMIIGLVGYNVQPLVDFRPFKVGTALVPENITGSDPQFKFIYEKDGQKQEFSVDSLPDSTWTFVDREAFNADSITENANEGFVIYDLNDEDVTETAIMSSGEQVILLFPELRHADVSYSYILNEMYNYITARGGDMIGVFAANDKAGIEAWSDLSLAQWPAYTAEDTSIKELARGKMSVVYLKDGVIKWKRTLSSIPTDIFSNKSDESALEKLYPSSETSFYNITAIYVKLLLGVFAFNMLVVAVKWLFSRKKEKKNVTLQPENNNDTEN